MFSVRITHLRIPPCASSEAFLASSLTSSPVRRRLSCDNLLSILPASDPEPTMAKE